MIPPTPRSTLFPYTTLFRSDIGADEYVPPSPPALLDCLAPDTTVTGKAKVKSKKKSARVSLDRKSTRLNSSHLGISYAVFCLKKKKKTSKKKNGSNE